MILKYCITHNKLRFVSQEDDNQWSSYSRYLDLGRWGKEVYVLDDVYCPNRLVHLLIDEHSPGVVVIRCVWIFCWVSSSWYFVCQGPGQRAADIKNEIPWEVSAPYEN